MSASAFDLDRQPFDAPAPSSRGSFLPLQIINAMHPRSFCPVKRINLQQKAPGQNVDD